MSNAEPISQQPPPDVPLRRFWWTKRLVVGYAVLAVLLPVSYWLWGRAADARVRAAEAALQAAGEPITAEGLNALQKPVADNAVPDIVAAARVLHLTEAQTDQLLTAHAWSDDDWRLAAKVAADNDAALRHLYAAAEKQGIDWGIDYRRLFTPGVPHPKPPFSRLLDLGRLVQIAARSNHQVGQDQAMWRDMAAFDQLRRAARGPAILYASMASVMLDRMQAQTWVDIAPTLQTARGGQGNGVLTRLQLARTANGLTACPDVAFNPHLVGALAIAVMADEERDYRHAASAAASWDPFRLPMSALVNGHPLHVCTLARTLEVCVSWHDALHTDPYAATRTWGGDADPADALDSVAAVAALVDTAGLRPALARSTRSALTSSAARRMTGIALAIRLYRLDHAMAWPARLDDLVPDYLDRLPPDPFGTDGTTFGYVPGPLPRLYSIGPDGHDDGGAITSPTPAGELPDGWQQKDLIVFLVSPEAAATRPGD